MDQNYNTVTLGMPIYNGEQFLEETLRSILEQTYPYFELVISDNASTDNTESICQDYVNRDSRIKYYRHDVNRGASWNYNEVFYKSKGKYFKWAAADDLLLPNFLESCVNILDEHSNHVLAYPKTQIIDGNGNKITDYEDRLHLDLEEPNLRLKQFIYTVRECNAVFGLIRREVLSNTRLIGNFIGSDLNLLAELSLYGKFYEIPERLFLRREHEKASSWDKSTENQLEFFDPKLRNKIAMPRTRRFFEMLKVILRKPLKLREKIKCFYALILHLVQRRDKYFKEWISAFRFETRRAKK